MPNQVAARKNAEWQVVSLAPDVCKTPMGSSTPPIPYPVIAKLADAVGTTPTVMANGDPLVVFDQSKVPATIGDAPGAAKGIVSGTVGADCWPDQHSTTVRAAGKPLIRHNDLFQMNGTCSSGGKGNTVGMVVGTVAPPVMMASGANAHVEPAEAEKGWLARWWEKAKHEVGEASHHPWEGVKGAVKGVLNTPSHLGELVYKVSAWRQAAFMEQAAATQALFGRTESAAQLAQMAQQTRADADSFELPKFKMSNAAQEGGDLIFTAVQIAAGGAGLVRSGVKALGEAGKVASAVETATAAANEARVVEAAAAVSETAKAADAASVAKQAAAGADAVGDVAKGEDLVAQASKAEAAMPAGNGAKIIARTAVKNGYKYEFDEAGRVLKIEGDLRLNKAQGRNAKAQLEAGGADRLPTDQGGHYIGRRFDGPTDDFNHFAQNGNFNNSAYRTLENSWQKAIEKGQSVRVQITPSYPGGSSRPGTVLVRHWIDGVPQIPRGFRNAYGG